MACSFNTSLGVPSKTILPPFKTITRSAIKASSKLCVIEMIVLWYFFLKVSIIWLISLVPFGSSIEVDSSKIIKSVSIASAPAIATRCFWPPDRFSGFSSKKSCILTSLAYLSIFSIISFRGILWFSRPKAISSLTVTPTNWLSGFWKIIPIFCLNTSTLFSVSFSPSIYISPLVTSSNPIISLAIVLLPLPLCPSMASMLPFSIAKDSWFKTYSSLP